MRRIFLLIISLFLLIFLGTMALAQKAVLQTDCGKFECEEKGAHFEDTSGPGNWTDEQAECICQYYTPEEWEKMYCALARPSEEEFQIWQDCGVSGIGPGGPPPEDCETIQPADLTQLTFLDKASDPDWSPDGSQIIFEEQSQEEGRIYLVNQDGTGLTTIGLGRNPSWSPVDNRIIYRTEDRSLFLVDLDEGWGSKVELAAQITEHGSWSPDGKKIVYGSYNVFGQSSSIWVMNSDGSGKTRLTTDEDGYCMASSFSYDGSKIAYLKGFISYMPGGGESEELNEIWVMDSDGSNKHMIYAPGDSGQLLFQRAWNKDNKILFMRTWYRGSYPQVWMINSDGSDSKVVVAGPAVYGDPVWDNAGTKVVITAVPFLESGEGAYNIWTFSHRELTEFFHTPFKYQWVSQSGTISTDGTAHEHYVNAGDTMSMSLTIKNRSIDPKALVMYGIAPGGNLLPEATPYRGAHELRVGVKNDEILPWIDSSSFYVNPDGENNRFAVYDGPDAHSGNTLTFTWNLKISDTAAKGTYNLYTGVVREFDAWARQVTATGALLPGEDIFWRIKVE